MSGHSDLPGLSSKRGPHGLGSRNFQHVQSSPKPWDCMRRAGSIREAGVAQTEEFHAKAGDAGGEGGGVPAVDLRDLGRDLGE